MDATAALQTKTAPQTSPARVQKVKQQASEYESVFIAQMLNSMTSGLYQDTGFDGGHGEQQWRTMLNEHTAKDIATKGGFGIAQHITRELLQAQEIAGKKEITQ